MKRYYLAYGSNLNVEQMACRCPASRIVGTAVINGWELLFKGSKTGSYLTIERNDEGAVPVAIWAVTGNDEKALDFYEGYPSFYYKKDFTVTEQATGKVIKAFAYIMDERRPLGRPSDFYVATCMQGYRRFGFDENVLRTAYKKSVEVCYEA